MQLSELPLGGHKLVVFGNWLVAWWNDNPLRLSICQENSDGDWVRHEDVGIEFGNSGCSLPSDEGIRFRVYLLVFEFEFRARFNSPLGLWRKIGNG